MKLIDWRAMKGLVIGLTLLVIGFTSRSLAQALSSLPGPDKDPFVGTWKANADKSQPKPDKVKASSVRTISRSGDEIVFSSRIERRDSARSSENNYRIRCDGVPHRVQCGDASCKTSCTYKAANRVEGETAGPDGKTSYWTREVSPDGQEMTVFGYHDRARTKLETLQVYGRVK
jgi:hypothetical protein